MNKNKKGFLVKYVENGGNILNASQLIDLRQDTMLRLTDAVDKKDDEAAKQLSVQLEIIRAMLDTDIAANAINRIGLSTLVINPILHPNLATLIKTGDIMALMSGIEYDGKQLMLDFTNAEDAGEAIAEIKENAEKQGATVTVEKSGEDEDPQVDVTIEKDGEKSTVTVAVTDSSTVLERLLKRMEGKKKIGGAARSIQEFVIEAKKENLDKFDTVLGVFNGPISTAIRNMRVAMSGTEEDHPLIKNSGLSAINDFIIQNVQPLTKSDDNNACIRAVLNIMDMFKVDIEEAKEILVSLVYMYMDNGVYSSQETKEWLGEQTYEAASDAILESLLFDPLKFIEDKSPESFRMAKVLGIEKESPKETYLSKLLAVMGKSEIVKNSWISEKDAEEIVKRRNLTYYITMNAEKNVPDAQKAMEKETPKKTTATKTKVETPSKKAMTKAERKAALKAKKDAEKGK